MTSAAAPTKKNEEVIAAARSGDGPALATVRGWMQQDIARASPHVFRVEGLVLKDTLVNGPRVRAEVFAPVTAFGHDDPLWQGLTTKQAIADVRACPPLSRWLQAKALAHMAAVERKLVLDSTLDATAHRKLHRELQRLVAIGQPVWQNWVEVTPAWRHNEFDQLVDDWRQAPLDWSEKDHFKTAWDHKCFGMLSAGALFNALDRKVREFFGLQVVWAQEPGLPAGHVAGLHLDPQEANRLAELLGVEFRFEPA